MPKGKKTETPPELDVASRLVKVRGLYGDNQAAFARRLGISLARWNNFERGSPLSHEVAIKLVRLVPALTLDWLYLGATGGLSVELARRLDRPAPEE